MKYSYLSRVMVRLMGLGRWIGAAAFACLVATGPALARSLTYSWPSNVGPLNPHLYSPNQIFAQALVYEPLVKYRADGRVDPWLATSWTLSDDGLVYGFKLREDVTFSDGARFDAAAAKANFDAILANRTRHAWLDLVAQMDRVEIAGPFEIRLILKRPYYPTLQELSLPRPFRFVSPAAMGEGGTAAGIKAPIGTGPWRLVETRLGQSDTFRRNDAYWGRKPAFETLLVKVIPDANARVIALQTGEIDLIYGNAGQIPPDAFRRFQSMGRAFGASVSQPLSTRAVALNTARAPLDERAVRLAVNRAVDRDAIVKAVLGGIEPRADFLFSPSVPYADLGLTPHAYDPAAAGRLLDEAGWVLRPGERFRSRDGKRLAVEVDFLSTNAQQKAISEVIQAQLAAVGIEAALVGEEESSIAARQKDGRFGMIFGETWGPPYEPQSFVSSMRAPSHADYRAQEGLATKPVLDGWIRDVLVTTDEATRRDLYRRILTLLHEEAVYLPISHSVAIEVHRPTVAGIRFPATINEFPFDELVPAGR